MARKVFFSFHYDRDVWRVAQVRNSWLTRSDRGAQPFFDKAEWESVKRRGVERWIEEQLSGTSVTVVLIGAETYSRPWVLHEIKRSHELNKGILGIRINGIKNQQSLADMTGMNPLDYVTTVRNGMQVRLSSLYPTYDWIQNDGRANMASWIEDAARAAGR